MYKKVYIVPVDRYDYFGGQKNMLKKFDRISDAFAFYKREKGFDFNYEDAYHITYPVESYFINTIEKTHAHPIREYNRFTTTSDHTKANAMFSTEEINHLMSFCVDDEEIII